MRLDQPTLEIVLMIVNLISCIVMITLWRINTGEKGPEVWALAAGSGTAAFFVMIFYPFIGNYAIFINNFGTLATYLFLLEGVLRFRGYKREPQRKVLMVFLLALFFLISFLNRDFPTARYLTYDIISFILLSLAAFFMLHRTRGIETAVHSISSGAFLLLAFSFAYRWSLALSGQIEAVQVGSTQHPFQAILFLIGLPFTVGWTYGLVIAIIYRTQKRLTEIATRDELTGLHNRRSLDKNIEQIFRGSNIIERHFLLLLFDINGFKAINDSYGHSYGDRILMQVAEDIQESIREDDFAVRFGGDEFVVLMYYEHDFDMELMLERLREAVESRKILDGRQVQLRVSIGTAVYPDDGLSMDELLLVADRRMYEEKYRRQLLSEVTNNITA